MKKAILFLLVVMLTLVLFGCANELETSYTDEENQQSTMSDDFTISVIFVNHDFESVIEASSNIFVGELIGVRFGQNLSDNVPNGDPLRVTAYIEYEFEVKDVIFSGYGRNPDTIKVYVHDYGVIKDDLGYNPMYDCTFYEGYEYLLPVKINDKAYFRHDVYHIPGNMVLSLNQEIAEYSSLMGTHSVVTETGSNLVKNVNKERLLSYVNDLIETKDHQYAYTGETDILKISKFSTNIYKVQVKKLMQTRKNNVVFGETFTIEILEVIKGKSEYGTDMLMIDFVGGMVEPGDIVYVGLNQESARYGETGIFFNMTSKKLFSRNDIDQIKQHLNPS